MRWASPAFGSGRVSRRGLGRLLARRRALSDSTRRYAALGSSCWKLSHSLPNQLPGHMTATQIDQPTLARRIVAEGLGSFFLFACVIGSGIMGENLSGGNDAVALLGNTLATGAILFVLITMLGPISGAHMNPAVSLVAASRRELAVAGRRRLHPRPAYLRHPRRLGRASDVRPADAATVGEGRTASASGPEKLIATFGLILTILGTLTYRRDWVASSPSPSTSLRPTGSHHPRASPTRRSRLHEACRTHLPVSRQRTCRSSSSPSFWEPLLRRSPPDGCSTSGNPSRLQPPALK